MKPMQVATSPNVRFQLPDLGSSSLSRGEFVASSSVAYYSPSTSAFSARLRLNSHSQLTSVKPPLSNSIDNHSHALHKAILDGRLTQLKYFLEMGLSANCVDRHMNKRSCLMLASITDQIDYGLRVARILLKYGADVNAQDGFGRTVLYYACTMNRTKLFEYLMNEENCVCVDMRQKDNDGNSLLNHVCAHGTPRMVELVGKCMAARGVECDQRNNLGYTALLLSIKHDRLQNALTLMKSCPNVSVTIRDWEKSMNAIEWLEYKINAYKGKSMESESDLLFRYCSNNNNNEDSNEATYSISRNSARTRTTGMSTTTPMGRLSSQQSNQSINTLASSKYLGRRKMSTSSTIETTSRATSCEASKQTIQELYKAIYSRMSMSSSLPFDYVLPPSASANAKDRRAHQNHTRHQQHTQHPQVRIEIDQKIRRPTPNVAADRALALFDQEAMRQTPKLVRLRKPSIDEETQPQSSKTLVHILFEMYDGSNRMKIKQKAVKPRLMMKRTSIVNIPLREKVSRGSIVSIPQRLKISSE